VEEHFLEHWRVGSAGANGVPGIEAECGGSRSCGTCHVYVEEADLARLPALNENEEALLDMGRRR